MIARQFTKYSLFGLIINVLVFTTSQTMSSGSPLHKTINGLDIYLGVLPAEMVLGHPVEHPESRMHGGVPPGTRFHILVALFNNKTGERINNASVTATVMGAAAVNISKTLEPMVIAGASSYGNYFKMAGYTPDHRIVLEIQGPDIKGVVRATFEWART
ncbi:MAG: hypothetical protein BMS9Abin36_0825 [Gammaproteobacteria bacterium]|nr:MAG: hypothetical protein BMS9Abin36_0825 [Gammaproteobacteria bacterium]